MKIHLAIVLACLVPIGMMAQRGGGGHGGGGMRGGGFSGGGMRSGGFGYSGGGFNRGFNGGFGFNRGVGFNRGFGFDRFRGGFGFGYGYPGYGYGYWPGYDYGYWPGYDYSYGYNSYPYAADYSPSPNVTVVYGPPQPAYQNYAPPSQAATGGYDQYGQRVPAPQSNTGDWGGSGDATGSPIYLIAFKDHVIRAAVSYSVSGNTLHYITLEHEDKQAPLDTVDRAFSAQLNRERHVAFRLPAQ